MARPQQNLHGKQQQRKTKRSFGRKPQRKEERRNERKGPRLPSSLRYLQNLGDDDKHEEDEEGSEYPPFSSDIYEYEEKMAPEEAHKNRRFDTVDRLEYELPSDFEDEDIEEGAADGEEDHGGQNKRSEGKKHFSNQKEIRGQQSDKEDDSDEEVSSKSNDMQDESNEDEDQNDNEYEELQGEEDVGSDQEESDVESEEEDDEIDERHQRMIEAVYQSGTKDPREKRPKTVELLSGAYPESGFNISPATDGNTIRKITLEDLRTPLQNTTGFGSLRKRTQQLEKKGVSDAPLPNAVQDRLSRKAGYEKAKEEISKWQEIVKKNREAASLVFTQRPDLTAVSSAELVSKFEPTTGLEKEIASLLKENGLAEENSDAGTDLGFNKVTMSEVKERQERLAKMRSMLSYHESKAKRMKKIKSKAFHRLLQKDRKSKAGVGDELDPEALKEAALKAEFKRAQERMTLKHKNTSKWAKRIIQRGQKAKEDGSREALAEQLRTHIALTRKIHAVDNLSSSDDSSDEMGADSGTEDEDGGLSLSAKPRSKVLAKAKVETLKLLEGDAEAEIPTSGLFSLPFMARAIEKKRKQAQNDAMAMLDQLEQLEYDVDGNEGFAVETKEAVAVASTGRLGFGDMAKSMAKGKGLEPDMLVEESSSSDDKDHVIPRVEKTPVISKKRKAARNSSIDTICNGVRSQAHELLVTQEAWTNGGLNRTKVSDGAVQRLEVDEEADIPLEHSEAGGSIDGASNPWLYGIWNGNEGNAAVEKVGAQRVGISVDERPGSLLTSAPIQVVKIGGGSGKVDKNMKAVEDGEILDLTPREAAKERASLSSSDTEEGVEPTEAGEEGFGLSTKNASQAELIQRAFAGDDVEADFEKIKSEALGEEVPMGEAALSLPGWGQWTEVQKRKGPPLWMVKQQEELKRSRDQALGKRKDSKLKHVIISERMDKKAEKFLVPALPFPFTSRDVYERSMRMPLGREYNTDLAFRDMIRPAVVKDAGVIIDPIKHKMDAKAGGCNGVLEEKKKSEKRANGPRLERKS